MNSSIVGSESQSRSMMENDAEFGVLVFNTRFQCVTPAVKGARHREDCKCVVTVVTLRVNTT